MNRLLTIIRQPFISLKYYSKHRDNNIWVFSEWFGQRADDNALYFANYVSKVNRNIKCYWIANDNADLHRLNNNIIVLKRDSKESKEIFKKCGVVIVGQGFIDMSSSANNYFIGALTINISHGVPWKKLFFDTLKHYSILKPISFLYSKLLLPKYYLSTSKEFDKICNSGYLSNNIIKSGQPRNCILFENSIKPKQSYLEKLNLPFDTKIICYMPTFRSNKNNTFLFNEDDKLLKILKNNNGIIIQKRHFADKSPNQKNNKLIFNVTNLSAQDLLQISDILITDYSSCFFDFLLKNKPIIHYIYDYNQYINERGLYYKPEDVCCGDICYTYNDLLHSINNALSGNDKDERLRKNRKEKYIERESVHNNSNIYNQITEILNAK